jgi:hypothetical protein
MVGVKDHEKAVVMVFSMAAKRVKSLDNGLADLMVVLKVQL